MSIINPVTPRFELTRLLRAEQKPLKYGCLRPDWCGFKDTCIHSVAVCLSAALYNVNSDILHKVRCYQELGLTEKTMQNMYLLSRLNHIGYYLFGVYVQSYLNKQTMEDYVCCDDLQCWHKNFRCEGIDISCIFECFNVCGYIKDCNYCIR